MGLKEMMDFTLRKEENKKRFGKFPEPFDFIFGINFSISSM